MKPATEPPKVHIHVGTGMVKHAIAPRHSGRAWINRTACGRATHRFYSPAGCERPAAGCRPAWCRLCLQALAKEKS